MLSQTKLFVLCRLSSDLTIKLKGKELPAHKFVLAARSDCWPTDDLSHASVLDLSGKLFIYMYLTSVVEKMGVWDKKLRFEL